MISPVERRGGIINDMITNTISKVLMTATVA